MEYQITEPPMSPSPVSSAPGAFEPGPQLSEARRSMRFVAEGGTLFGLLLLNALLSGVTLGVYSFWGRARVRKFIFQHTELDGARFDYHGTGGELLVGFLKVLGVFFGLIMMAAIGMKVTRALHVPQMSVLFILAIYAVLLYLMPYAIVGSQRYQRSRTSWRDTRFRFTGTVEQLSVPFIKGVLLSVVTLGFYRPYFMNTLWGFSLNHTYYGGQRFSYDGDGDGLFRPYVKAFFLGFVTFGIAWVWYIAEQARYLAAHTHFGKARFESTVTTGSIFKLMITNILLMVVTLGWGLPWIIVRTLRFQFENLVVVGEIEAQSDLAGGLNEGATGDAMADALGIDTGLDAGFGI